MIIAVIVLVPISEQDAIRGKQYVFKAIEVFDYYFSLIAMDQGVCERYSLGHGVSSFLHELPESVDINKPRLLTA